ncbi:MAG: TonB-dependent receptor [Hellea sp.]|nr:TonB-dependent receptor [Hellea sp.]
MSRKWLNGSAICLYAALLGTSAAAQSEDGDILNGLDVITVTGTIQNTDTLTSAITFIGPEELEKQSYGDINRVLRAAPGINIQEEEGYGLRPNIGLRGSGSDRSSKVLIMEDGVLMAPAPYASPSAYYFPMTGRMNAVEVTKGAATVKYGPNTTAGAIHFFSTPIPKNASAHAELMASDLGRIKAHAWAGSRFDAGDIDIGFLLETYQDHADGFKDIDRGGDSGFDIEDYTAKLGFYAKDGDHSLELKYQYKDEISNETYLGLSQADFAVNPNRRYNASQLDQMVNDHTTYQATHNIALGNWQLTTIGYRTEFARNWRKLDRFDNSGLSGSSDCNSLPEIIDNPALCNLEYNVLVGADGFVSPDDVLGLRHNNRTYYAHGIQSALGGVIETGDMVHNLVVSVRYHEDEVDRFQQQDQYRMDNGAMVITTDNAPGTQANRLSGAEALSAYVEDRIEMGDVSVTAGLRIEDVMSMQRRWDTPDRTLPADSTRMNVYTKWLPALSAKFDLNDQWSIMGGAHRGFAAAPVSSRQSTSPEESFVYEGGFRYRGDATFDVDTTFFFNDYSNLLGECTNSTGGSGCDLGDAFNAGKVNVMGVEISASADIADWIKTGLSIPVSLSYTFTDGEFQTSFSNDFWGNVIAGDELPYVAQNQLTLSAGIQDDHWGLNTTINALGDVRDVAGQGEIPMSELVKGRAVLDMAAYYDLREGIRLKIKAENLLDADYAAARRPYGLRPGKPREIFAGISLDF